jgi:hypothetical protein
MKPSAKPTVATVLPNCADRDTLKIHRLLHKTFDKTPCFRPSLTAVGRFHAGFK